MYAQQSFVVVDENDQSLQGVEVFTNDFSFTEITNEKGAFVLNTDADTLNLRYLGFENKKLVLAQLSSQTITLRSNDFLLEEVLIVGRTGVAREEIPYQVETISSKTIKNSESQTSADVLAANGNVFIQKSQMGGGSPVLRGFEANKILLVIDGVRLNNAIYRSGHLQNAITIDPAVLDRMELIYGAGSLNYGSDALGGVIHFKSKDSAFSENDKFSFYSNYRLRHSTANSEKSIHYDLNIGSQKWASLTSVSFASYGDLIAGGNRDDRFPTFGKRSEYVETINGIDSIVANTQHEKQIGTAYDQLDLFQKFKFQPSKNVFLTFNGQYSTSSDVPRYDRLTELDGSGVLKFAEWYYGPQNRLLLSGQLKYEEDRLLFDKILFIPAFQKVDEDRIDRNFKDVIRIHNEEDVLVYSATLDLEKSLNPQSKISYGTDVQLNRVKSEAYEENIETNDINYNVLSRYPSTQSSLNTFGVYGKFTWKSKNERFISNTGIRYQSSTVDLAYDPSDPFPWPQDFIDGLETRNSALVGSTGFNYNTENKWQIHGLAATGFRSPNIDDLAKIRVKGNEVSVPNLELSPEKSFNLELGVAKKMGNKGYVQATGFWTKLNDAIIREALALPDGSTFILDGLDTIYTFGNVNAEKAIIYGLSTDAKYKFSSALSAFGALNFTKGEAINNDENKRPLSHIPPIFGKLGFNYSLDNLELSLDMRFNAQKDIKDFGDSTDNPEQATPIGSLAWKTYNFYVRYPYLESLELSLGVENILNLHYRTFASGVSAPGRNFIVSLKGSF